MFDTRRNPVFISGLMRLRRVFCRPKQKGRREALDPVTRRIARKLNASIFISAASVARSSRAKTNFTNQFNLFRAFKPNIENISLFQKKNLRYSALVPIPFEGRFAVVTNVGSGMRWTRRPRETSVADAYGEIVWS
jgi:hypothetical protein